MIKMNHIKKNKALVKPHRKKYAPELLFPDGLAKIEKSGNPQRAFLHPYEPDALFPNGINWRGVEKIVNGEPLACKKFLAVERHKLLTKNVKSKITAKLKKEMQNV